MFTGFLYHLRAHGLKVGLNEWIGLIQALSEGHGRSNLSVVYHLARARLALVAATADRHRNIYALMRALGEPISPPD